MEAMKAQPTKTLDLYVRLPSRTEERFIFSSSAPFTPTYVSSNLSLSSDPMGMYNARVKGRQILLENPVRDSRAKKELEAKRTAKKKERERKKLGIISKKEARQKEIWKFDKAQAKFDLFLPLHGLWMGYMSELLGLPPRPSQTPSMEVATKSMPNSSGMHPRLLKADFHGSIMTVSQNKNPCIVGLSGIVIHETENAFKVVTRDNKLKLLPKANAVFKFSVPLYSTLPPTHNVNTPLPIPSPKTAGPSTKPLETVLDVPHIEFELYGNQFRFRGAERAGRKFKHKETIEL